nr:hypothetical protein [Tanacetum cinerariifolium]
MATTIEQQTALDESLVPSSQRLRIGRSNFRLPSDIQSKEATLQVVYDVLRNSPLLRAFQVTADGPEIYMQEFWATAKLHHNSIRFKIDTRKSVLNLEAFREMLHISPRIPNQPFADLPTEEEIMDFLRFLGHSHDIRYLTDVNVNKLYQPWRSFASVINKCLTGKSSGVDSFRLSQAQILWGFYHRINIDFAFLIWEDFVKKKGDSASSITPPNPTPTTTIESAPRLSATAKGKQPSRATTPIETTDIQRTEMKELVLNQEFRMYQLMTRRKNFRGNLLNKDVGSHEEGKESDESDDDRDEGSDNDSEETVKSGAGKDDDDDDNDED